MSDRVLVDISGEEVVPMREALRQGALPADDLSDEARCFALRDCEQILGWGALEIFGEDALLRSILIPVGGRGRGAGTDLVGALRRAAASEGVTRLWLLTNTAEPFFLRLGFEETSRESAPEAIRETSEFKGVCPASATCMMARL